MNYKDEWQKVIFLVVVVLTTIGIWRAMTNAEFGVGFFMGVICTAIWVVVAQKLRSKP